MTKQIKVGDRVRYDPSPESHRKGPAFGVVTQIRESYEGMNEAGPYTVPESAVVLVDEFPSWWAYADEDRFCPATKFLTVIE